jgi:hypothetical protein
MPSPERLTISGEMDVQIEKMRLPMSFLLSKQIGHVHAPERKLH